jgi:hypothetical protein
LCWRDGLLVHCVKYALNQLIYFCGGEVLVHAIYISAARISVVSLAVAPSKL